MISIVYGQARYHEAVCDATKPGDIVIEIGPHTGKGTRLIAKKAKKVIAIDKSKQSEAAFKERPDNVTFLHGDVRFFETIDEVLKLTKSCDVLAVDMGGGRFPDTVFKVWAIWSGVLKPRDSVIRNCGLGEFLKRAKIDDPLIDKTFPKAPDSGWLSQTGRKTPSQLKDGLDEMKNWIVDI